MKCAPGREASSGHNASAIELEMLADDFLAFIDAFEAALNEGAVPVGFAERLAQLQQRAERLI